MRGDRQVLRKMAEQYKRRTFFKQAAAASAAGLVAAGGRAFAETGSTTRRRIRSQRQVKESLLDAMRDMDVIDAHEHLRPEPWRLKFPVNVLTLFSIYPTLDLSSSVPPHMQADGIRNGYVFFHDENIPLEERWKAVAPLLKNIRFGSFYRAPMIALRDIYGVDELNDSNWRDVSEKIQAANKPGIYQKILRDRCRIKTALVQCSGTHLTELAPRPLLTPVYSGSTCYKHSLVSFIDRLNKKFGVAISSLDEYLEVLKRYLSGVKKNGAAAFKTYASGTWTKCLPPDVATARKIFDEMLKGGPSNNVLEAAILDRVFNWAGEWDWPVSVHGGGNYMDFRDFQPRRLLDVIIGYPQTRFDLFHLGMPFPRQMIFMAKQFPNMNLNLTWAQTLSESITRQSINEIIDAVPTNKVTAFGGDCLEDVENVYGHLEALREILAEAFAERVVRGRINEEDALHIAKLWLHDNPAKFYAMG